MTKRRTARVESPLGRPGGPGVDPDALGLGVAIMRTAGGSAVVVPRSVRNLPEEQLEVVAQVQDTARHLDELQERLTHLVGHLRDAGASWGVIGWSVGTTSQAARQRWGKDADEDQVHDDRGQVSALGGYTPRNR